MSASSSAVSAGRARSAQSGLGLPSIVGGLGMSMPGEFHEARSPSSQLSPCAAAAGETSNIKAVASTANVERANWRMRDVSFSANDERYQDGGQPQSLWLPATVSIV